MRPHVLRGTAILALVAATLACGDDTTAPAPIALVRTVWYLHEADTTALPARIHQRTLGVILEETYVDSAELSLTAQDTYEQTIYLRIEHNGLPDRSEIVIDRGLLTAEGAGYRLTSTMRTRDFTLRTSATGVLDSEEEMLFLESGRPLTLGRYRLIRP